MATLKIPGTDPAVETDRAYCCLHPLVLETGFIAWMILTAELLYVGVYPAMLKERYGEDLEFVVKSWMMVALSAFAVVGGVFLGALSDRVGRRPILVLSILSSAMPGVVILVTDDVQLWAITWALRGLLGGAPGGYATFLYAIVADVTTPVLRGRQLVAGAPADGVKRDTRSIGVAVVTGGMSLGVLSGGLLTSFLAEPPWDPEPTLRAKMQRIFSAQIAFMCLAAVSAMFFVPSQRVAPMSPLSPRNTDGNEAAQWCNIGRWKRAWESAMSQVTLACRNRDIAAMLGATFLLSFSQDSYHDIGALYGAEFFGWTSSISGAWVAASGAAGVVASLLLLPFLLRWGKLCAFTIGTLTAVFASAMALFGGSSLFFASGLVMNFAYCGKAGGTAQVSSMVPVEEQGAMMGLLGAMTSLSSIAGPLSVGYLERYHASLPGPLDFPAVPYSLLLASSIVGTLLAAMTWCREFSPSCVRSCTDQNSEDILSKCRESLIDSGHIVDGCNEEHKTEDGVGDINNSRSPVELAV